MPMRKFLMIVALLALFTNLVACELSGPRPGWISAGCARSLGIKARPDLAAIDVAALTGAAVQGDPDRAAIELNGQTAVVIGYANKDNRPHVAVYGWDGFDYSKEADLVVQGSGTPVFSGARATAPAGVRNLNSFGADEVVARTDGDCGEGSSRYSVLSRDGRNRWTLIFSGCERKGPMERTAFESVKGSDGRESLTIATYPSAAPADAAPVRTATLAWDGSAWRVSQTGDRGDPGRSPGLDVKPPPGLERMQLKFPTFNRGPLFPGQGGPGGAQQGGGLKFR